MTEWEIRNEDLFVKEVIKSLKLISDEIISARNKYLQEIALLPQKEVDETVEKIIARIDALNAMYKEARGVIKTREIRDILKTVITPLLVESFRPICRGKYFQTFDELETEYINIVISHLIRLLANADEMAEPELKTKIEQYTISISTILERKRAA